VALRGELKKMQCVVCEAQLELERGEVCSTTECIDKWLKSGHGSISGDEYKRYMDRCFKRLRFPRGQMLVLGLLFMQTIFWRRREIYESLKNTTLG